MRSWRYSILVKDGVIEKMFIEPEVEGDPFEASDADTVLRHIAPDYATEADVSLFTKPGCHCARAKQRLEDAGLSYEEIALGQDITSRHYASTVEWVADRAPHGYRRGSNVDFVSRATGNLYFWYYGSLALFRHGGVTWEAWNRGLQDTLLPAQEADGSWRPVSLYAEFAGDTARDRSYTTAMCVLTLEVYYRYFTPLLTVR